MHDDGIRRSAKRLRVVVFGAMAIMVLLYASARLGLGLGRAHVEYRIHGPNLPSTRLIGDISVLLVLIALFQLTQMLGRIAAGEMFSAAVIGRFRSFAFWLLLVALFGVLAPLAAHAMRPSAKMHRLELAIDFRDVLTIGATLVLFLIARLLERARRLEEEMREFV